MKKILVFLVLILLIILILLWYFVCRVPGEKRPPILLKTASGVETTEFQLHDSILFDAVKLSARAGYRIQIVREDGETVAESVLSTDRFGRIPETVIWYDIGILPCLEAPAPTTALTHLSEYEIGDFKYAGKDYTLKIISIEDKKLVREMAFRVGAKMIRPKLYAADSRGCPKSGFLIGEENVWAVGKYFPKGSIVRLWTVPAETEWKEADMLKDVTRQYDGELPPLFELKVEETSFKRLLWPKGLTSIGSYDIVAEVVTYPFGSYHPTATAQVQNVLANFSYSGFVIQRRQGIGEPLEQDVAGVRMSKLAFRDAFLTTEKVYVGVDPYVQPGYIGKTADVYIVAHKMEAQWISDPSLSDVTGTVESVSIQPGNCANFYSTLAWAAPLIPGEYDVVMDFDRDGQYTHNVDLIDSLDPVGFTVAEVRVESISFNYSGSGAITIYDNVNGSNINPPEYSCGPCNVIKPAAWIMGGSYSVRVDFKAVPAVNSAQIWAENGLGGLESSGSPVSVNFNGGVGQANFSANSVPNSVGKLIFDWSWKYKNINNTSTPDFDMGKTGNHTVYTVLAAPIDSMAVPWLEILDYACTWANGATTKENVCIYILDNGFKNHYTWNMDCMRLASDFVRLVSTQGISGSQHRWASKGFWGDVGDMAYQKTKAIDPVGSTWGYQQIQWSWHQWAKAEGKQRDPSAGASLTGNWGAYEDYLFAEYERIKDDNPYDWEWVANQAGQSLGCEASNHRSSNSNPTFYSWRGPDR